MEKNDTQQAILKAARQLFVEHGFSGTSIGKIAKLAQVNHSLIFHHFTNKAGLWSAVKQSIAREAEQHRSTLPDLHLPFMEFLRVLFTDNIQFYRANPDIVRMINWQRLEPKQNIGITLSPLLQAWIDAFKHYQQQGEINNQLSTEYIVTLVLSIISSTALDPNMLIQTVKAEQEYIDFCLNCLLKALS